MQDDPDGRKARARTPSVPGARKSVDVAHATARTKVVVVSLEGDVLDLLATRDDFEVIGFLDRSTDAADPIVPNVGSDQSWDDLKNTMTGLKAVLAVDPPAARATLASHYGLDRLATVIADTAFVSPTAEIGRGCIIQRDVLVGRGARLGTAVKLNCGAQLHHGVTIGDFSTIAPGARLLGNVRVGARSYVGSEAVILPRIQIGDQAVIGAGAVVTRNVPAGSVVKGTPARSSRTAPGAAHGS